MMATTLRLSRRTLPLASKRLFSAGGSIWQNCVAPPDIPGLKVKTAFDAAKNPTGHETMLEMWEAGTSEPPHSHPGDDMTVVVDGHMTIQFFTKNAQGKLLKDGSPVTLKTGQTGYVAAGRIHDAKYVSAWRRGEDNIHYPNNPSLTDCVLALDLRLKDKFEGFIASSI